MTEGAHKVWDVVPRLGHAFLTALRLPVFAVGWWRCFTHAKRGEWGRVVAIAERHAAWRLDSASDLTVAAYACLQMDRLADALEWTERSPGSRSSSLGLARLSVYRLHMRILGGRTSEARALLDVLGREDVPEPFQQVHELYRGYLDQAVRGDAKEVPDLIDPVLFGNPRFKKRVAP